MNLIDAFVIEIKTDPYEAYGRWWVSVAINAYGVESVTELMFKSKEEAEDLRIGKKVLV